jgi:hypothetical protein
MAASGRRMALEVCGVVMALWLLSRWLRLPQMLACRKVRVGWGVCLVLRDTRVRVFWRIRA